MTILTKVRESQDSLASPSESAGNRIPSLPAINTSPDQVSSLARVDEETLRKFTLLRDSLRLEIQQQFAEGKFAPGIYVESGKTYYVIPDSLLGEEDVIGGMICDLASQIGIEVKHLPNIPVNYTSAFDKKFIMGLWFGMFSSAHLKRRRGKQSYELGRTASFSLLIKNVFERDANLGSKALCKDNFFFGNNPNEMSPKGKVPFYVKAKLLSMFEQTAAGNLVYGILNHAASQIGLTNLKDDERDAAILDSLIPVDQVIASCYPTVTMRRGRQMVQQSKRPNPIRSSPLFLKEEMTLISSLTSYIFTDLGAFTKNYLDSVFTHGFSFVNNEIRRIINVRLETLQRFAHVTKERLQAIRKIVKKPTVRKAGVLREDVLAFLDSVSDPARKLVQELRHILGAASYSACCSYAFKRKPSNFSEYERFLYIKALNIYVDIRELSFSKTLKYPTDIQEPLEIDFEKGIKALREVESKCAAFSANLRNIAHIYSFKIFGRTEKIKGLKSNINNVLNTFMKLSKLTRDTCVNMYFDQHYTDDSSYINYMKNYLNELQTNALKTLRIRVYEENSENVENILRTLLEIISEPFDIKWPTSDSWETQS
jgi:hypothetical protein